MMEFDAFAYAIERAASAESGGIGTLGEKTLHAVLKYYFAPDAACHEQKVSGFVADIFTGYSIYEIQTANFYVLRRKLEAYLPDYPVTVVYPVMREKRVAWANPETGLLSDFRKSPRRGTAADILYELYFLRAYLGRENLRFCVVLYDGDELRLQNGWGKGGKRGASRMNRVPRLFAEKIMLACPQDYLRLLPPGLPCPFTAKDLQAGAKISLKTAQMGLQALLSAGAVTREGKKGNAFLYVPCAADWLNGCAPS